MHETQFGTYAREQHMSRLRIALPMAILLLLSGLGWAADQDSMLLTATGTVDKADKTSLTITPRGRTGRFEKSIALKVTGTSNLSLLTTQKRAGKTINVQRSVDAGDLSAGQNIAVIYTTGPTGSVVLAAVVQPASNR